MTVFVEGDSEDHGPASRFEQLADLAPSAKLVYKVLELEGPLTQSRLADETRLAPRTTRYAITELEEGDLVEEEIYIPDARKKLYRAKEIVTPD